MRFCGRALCVVNDGWRVRCLHWVAVVLVGFFRYSRFGKCWTSYPRIRKQRGHQTWFGRVGEKKSTNYSFTQGAENIT
jgi:hypothetical protein